MRQERFVTISVIDPGLDTDSMTYDEVMEFVRRREWSLVEKYIKPGGFPTRYHLRECPNELWPWVRSAGDDHAERDERAFRACVERVENVYQRDGVRVEDWSLSASNGTPKAMAEAESFKFPHSDRAEIGRVAYEHSFLARRIEDCFRLHPSLVEALGRRTVRRAESSHTPASETSNAQPSGSSGTTPATTDSGSVPAVVA